MLNSARASKTLIFALASLSLTACGGDEIAAAPTPTSSAPPAATKTASAPAQALSSADMLMERGAKLYKRCQSCHTLEQDGRHKVGPNMWGLYGSTAGAKEGFAYSKAMSESGIVWTDETLSGYIENPRKYMPGNRMSYVGLRKPEDREAVLAFIKAKTTPE